MLVRLYCDLRFAAALRYRKHRINVKQKADFGFPSSTQPTRSAIALQRLHEHEVAVVGVHAGGSGSMAEKPDSVISQLKV